MKKTIYNYLVVICLIVILCFPLIAKVVDRSIGIKLDIKLHGYTQNVEKPEWSMETYLSRVYQSDCDKWLEKNMYPRGMAISIQRSLNERCFNTGTNAISVESNGYLMQRDVINSYIGVEQYNYESLSKRDEMAAYVAQLVTASEKLEKVGKKLFFYVPISKAGACSQEIKYVKYYNHEVSGEVCLRELLEDSGVDFLYTEDLVTLNEVSYPIYYKTGCHTSRSFEQITTKEVISRLSDITNKKYRNLQLGECVESDSPYWRDSDLANLMNLLIYPQEKYYQYVVDSERPDEFDKMRILMQGDSFGEGFRKDVLDTYPFEEFFFISYGDTITKRYEDAVEINNDWDTIDLGYYLDQVDVVVIEACPQNIPRYSSGFLTALNKTLDQYEPNEKRNTAECFDVPNANVVLDQCKGLHPIEEGYVWTKPHFEILLNNADIRNGLEIAGYLPEFVSATDDNVVVYINGKKAYDGMLSAGEIRLRIDADKIVEAASGDYDIEVYCSNYYNPFQAGASADNRDLALQLSYVGSIRE